VATGDVPPLNVDELNDVQRELRRKTHQTIAKVGDDMGRRYTFNTAVAASMELLNAVTRLEDSSPQSRAVVREALDAVVAFLSPIVPHICHELWEVLGHETAVVDERWPNFDESALEQDRVEIVVQVNGKLRAKILAADGADADTVAAVALADENVQRFIAGKEVRKTIFVPGRLVNIVV
jgi:leucyl-tRNA synthetase